MSIDSFGRSTPTNSYTNVRRSGSGYNTTTGGYNPVGSYNPAAGVGPQVNLSAQQRPWGESVMGYGTGQRTTDAANRQFQQAGRGNAERYVNSQLSRQYDPNQQIIDVFMAQAGPTMAGFQNQQDLLNLRLQGVGANQQMQSRYANQDFANQMAMLGLDRQGLGIQQQSIADRDAYLTQLLGFAGRGLDQANRGFDVDQRESGERREQDTWRHRSDLTARGAFHTPFQRIGQSWIDQEAANRDARIGLGREGAQLGFDRESASIADQRRANQRARQELSLQAQRIGVTERQYRQALDRTLESLGLDSFFTVNDLMQQANSNDMQRNEFVRSIMQQAEQAAIINPEMYTTGPERYTPPTPPQPSRSGTNPHIPASGRR